MKNYLLLLLVPLFLFSCKDPRKGKYPERRTEQNESKNQEVAAPEAALVPVTATPFEKPIVNVYVENSGSMLGYINGQTDFIHSLYNYLSDIRIADIASEINLFYINKSVIYRGNDIPEFINQMSSNNFLIGNTGTSDIADVLGTVLSETTSNTISILVSDFIFSPGNQIDAKDYLNNQQTSIKNQFADKLKENNDLAAVIYQLYSQFEGYYYNIHDKTTKIDAIRPYYIWVMGDADHISHLKKTIPDNRFKGSGIKNSYTILPTFDEIEYAVLSNPKYGSFKRDKEDPTKSIYDLNKEKKGMHSGEFMFTIGADLSVFNTLLGNSYIMDDNNYLFLFDQATTENFSFNISQNSNISESNHTHHFQIMPHKLPTGELEIFLTNKIPQWVHGSNDEIGMDINTQGAMEKTFGIKNVVQGVFEAYETLGYTNYWQMKIILKK
jgi:hypothetical protein